MPLLLSTLQQEALARILRASTCWPKPTQYTSGMNFIVAGMLLACKDEYLTFVAFTNFAAKVGLLCAEPDALRECLDMFEKRLAARVPEIAEAFEARSIDACMFAAAPL